MCKNLAILKDLLEKKLANFLQKSLNLQQEKFQSREKRLLGLGTITFN
jgi:hypothetical protein